jgi:hypothetical protein
MEHRNRGSSFEIYAYYRVQLLTSDFSRGNPYHVGCYVGFSLISVQGQAPRFDPLILCGMICEAGKRKV